jgi:hypothetical protein
MKKLRKKEQLGYNISYSSSAAAVVFGWHLFGSTGNDQREFTGGKRPKGVHRR